MTFREDFTRWRTRAIDDPDLLSDLQALSDLGSKEELDDRFYRDLEFGTGGLRGELGAGSNRMNIYTVRKATQGLANYLNGTDLPRRVAIGCDSRIKSRRFATEAARVLAGNGITVHIYPRLEPTPAISWAVRALDCGAGICVTASHNPARYNGYKVYGHDGCQITLETAAAIQKEIAKVDCFDDVRLTNAGSPLINEIQDECLDAFVDAVCAQSPARMAGEAMAGCDLKLVYTPLNGAGLECVERLLKKLGIKDVAVVHEQAEPDGHFPTCPYPNPEIREALQKGLDLCRRVRPDLLLATDPDCDRMGSAVPDREGGYRLISGNEMGVLLLDYICRRRTESGTMPERPVAVTTIVTTEMLGPVAEKYGVELRRMLTGFKFIGEQIGVLEAAGQTERFIFGCEESYGYLSGPHVRDKDAVNAVMLACEMADYYKHRGETLLDALEALYREFGYYRNGLESFGFDGQAGMQTMNALMDGLRTAPPTELGSFSVERAVDYADGATTGLPAANVLEFHLSGGAKLTVRPSGTEPKIKFYLSCRGESAAEVERALSTLRQAAGELMESGR